MVQLVEKIQRKSSVVPQPDMQGNIHILLLTYVIVEVLFSIPCFLTVMENSCRKKSNRPLYTTGFFDYWVETLFVTTYRNWLFIAILSLLAIFSFILYFAVPPLSS